MLSLLRSLGQANQAQPYQCDGRTIAARFHREQPNEWKDRQLQVDSGPGTDNGQNLGARVAMQQRVTSNLLVTFATDITSALRQAIQIEYKFNPKWSVSGTRDQNGGFGVDGRYRKDF
jgi:hypothetical protein